MSPAAEPVVVVMPDPPAGFELGSAVEGALAAHAVAWARQLAPERTVVADAGATVWQAVLAGRELHRDALGVIIVRSGFPRLAPVHAADALSDLRAGTGVSIGSDGGRGWYLLAARDPVIELLVEEFEAVMRAGVELGLELGMLRNERPLLDAADARAAAADPLTPPVVVSALDDR